MIMTTIAPALTKQDFNTIARLAHTIWTEHYTPIIGEQQVSYMLDKFQSAQAMEDQVKEGYHYYLLQHENTPVGYFSFNPKDSFLFLSKLYVLSSERGKGIGRKAIEFIENQAKKLGKSKIRLTVNKFNSNSIAAYEKIGFVNIDSIVQDIGNGFVMDDYVLERKLDE